MVVSNTIFSNLFGGHNVKPKSTNTEKQTFIDSDADIVDAKFTVLDERKPFIYTQKPQNNHERNPDFTQDSFYKSVFSSSITDKVAQASVSNGFPMPSRLSRNDSRGSLRPFNSPDQKEEIFGAKLALIG